MDYHLHFSDQLATLKDEGRYRVFAELERPVGEAPYAYWHGPQGLRKVIVWCSNDYLGMSHHPEVMHAMTDAVQRYGAGSGGTRNIAGTAHEHALLEKEVAHFHQKEKGLIFTSGYAANEASISALAQGLPDCVLFSDEKNHASMIHGMRSSRCEKRIFKHNDLVDLEQHLKEIDPQRPKIIAFISVYSMDGDIAPVEAICDLAKKYNALTYLDEVHAVGLYGKQGAGIAEHLGVQDRLDIIQGNFAKAIGVVGGYITGSHTLIDYVRSFASGFIFTTSLPPSVAAAARASIRVLRESHSLRQILQERSKILKKKLCDAHLPCIIGDSHIVPVVVGNAIKCRALSEKLLNDYGLYIQPINYPTVPVGQERLRITVSPLHTEAMIDELVSALVALKAEFF